MRSKRQQFGLLMKAAVLFVFLAAISLATAGQNADQQTSKKVYVRTGQEGNISGTIIFNGQPPARKFIDESADEACAKMNPKAKTEDVLVAYGRLANVFIYIKSGSPLENYSFETPSSEVMLEHRKCRYVPHLLGIQTQQGLKIINSDPTTHNTHPLPKINQEWNYTQPNGSEPLVKKFSRPETFISFRCNQHPWEKAYVGVFSHPFFAISDQYGSYRIEGLPPGDYTIVAWHERFGEQTISLRISPNQTKILDFTFSPEEQH